MERARLAEKKVSEDSWVKLARLYLETFVKTGERLEQLPNGLPAEMTEQAGAHLLPGKAGRKKYGVIVSCGGRRGLLLPDLEGVDTVEQQIDIARQKGGISSWDTLERFEVVRHT